MKKKSISITVFILILLLASPHPASAKTKRAALLDFLDARRQDDFGFSNSSGSGSSISASTDALNVYTTLGEPINHTLQLIHYYQEHQESSGGFNDAEGENASLEVTTKAVEGLFYLGINATELFGWKVFDFLNSSLDGVVYKDSNRTSFVSNTPSTLRTIRLFITTSFSLGAVPKVKYNELTDIALSYQYANGSYPTLIHALEAMQILELLGSAPSNYAGAERYIFAHQTDEGMFSFTIGGDPSLVATYLVLQALSDVQTYQIDNRDKLLEYVLDLQNKDGGFGINSTSTITETRMAVSILRALSSLNELGSPVVLQTAGFISYSFMAPLILLAAATATRLRHKRLIHSEAALVTRAH